VLSVGKVLIFPSLRRENPENKKRKYKKAILNRKM